MWSEQELMRIEDAEELEISVRLADGSQGRWVPIWVVRAGDQVYVRTWRSRETGWYGRALSSGEARIRVPGVEADVTIEAVGVENREGVDSAYRAEYARYGASSVGPMVADEAAATTLRLTKV